MNMPISGTDGYPLITFRMKNGKFDRAEVEGYSDTQNAEFTDRITPRPADEVAAKMEKVDENTKSCLEVRNGKLVTLRPMPIYLYGEHREDQDFQSEMREKIYAEMYEIFSNGADMGKVEQTLRDVVKQMDEYMYSEGYPTGNKGYTEQLLNDSYNTFRQDILRAATRACEDKGRELYPYNGQGGDWKYYDSDFYYKSEDVLAVLGTAVKGMAGEMGLEAFELKSKDLESNLTYNFNSAWRFSVNVSTVMDTTIPPPKDFSFYMNNGKDGFGEVKIGDYTERFSDAVGIKHYKFVGEMMRVDKNDIPDAAAVNRFLDNLCFFDTHGMLKLHEDDRWVPSSRVRMDTRA